MGRQEMEVKDYSVNRRALLARAGAGIAALGLPAWAATDAEAAEDERLAGFGRRIGPNDTIQIACIGPGGSKGGFRQGLGDTRNIARLPGIKVVAVCDVEKQHMDEAAAAFGPDCRKYTDFRELLDQSDIDAVVIGTPDHWHAVQACAAMEARKDVYCEKPLTLWVDEGKAIVRTQNRTGRVFQVGSQQRSDGRFRTACELVRNGRVGRLQRVVAHVPNGSRGGPFTRKPVPEGLDWDFWQGPAQWRDYIPERTHGNFRHWYEYSGGMVTDWGAHHLDIAQWGIGADEAGPTRVESHGVLPAHADGYNTPVDFEITYTYPNGVKLICTHEGENGVHFYGDAGWIFVSRSKIEASDPRLLSDPLPGGAVRLYNSNNHAANWVECLRQRKDPICTAEVGHRSVTVCHLGNISLRMGGRRLAWDPQSERFVDDEEANKMLSRPLRAPWKLPTR